MALLGGCRGGSLTDREMVVRVWKNMGLPWLTREVVAQPWEMGMPWKEEAGLHEEVQRHDGRRVELGHAKGGR